MDQELLRKEVYVVPYQLNTLVYAPLTRHVALYEGEVCLDEIDPSWIAAATDPANVPAFIEDRSFVYDTRRIRLRLNITSRCNLACKYCSVNALTDGRDMPIKTAFAAVQGFVARGKELGSRELEVVFSGGEPTMRMDYIEKVVQFAHQETVGTDLKLFPRILTNGLFPERHLCRIKELFQEVQVSWDGDFEGNPRYGSNGHISHQVWTNLLALLSASVTTSVVTVVSPENQQHLHRIVDKAYEAGVRHIFLAFKEALGRSDDGGDALDYQQLARVYLQLWHEYQAKGMEINLTGTDVHAIAPFPCSVPIPNYSVAPDGGISACTTAFNDASERAAAFRIGIVKEGGLRLDQESILSVRRYSVLNMDGCKGCFAKWHCRGGCPYSKQRLWPDPLPGRRCDLIRTVVAEKILALLR